MRFSKAVVKAMEQSGMTRQEFQHRGNFSRAYVTMLLNGKIEDPKFSRAKEVCDALGISLNHFSKIYDGIRDDE